MNCIHQEKGLCRNCLDWYERDRTDYLLHGDHLEGLKRREAKEKQKVKQDPQPKEQFSASKFEKKS